MKAGSSETVELPRSSVYSIHVSGKAANGTSFSNTFSGTIDNSSSVTISLDDFVITYFTKGAGMNTISTMIYQQVRRGINPKMYALSTILFLLILIVLWIANRISARQVQGTRG